MHSDIVVALFINGNFINYIHYIVNNGFVYMWMQAVLVFYERLPSTSDLTMVVQENHEYLSSASWPAGQVSYPDLCEYDAEVLTNKSVHSVTLIWITR